MCLVLRYYASLASILAWMASVSACSPGDVGRSNEMRAKNALTEMADRSAEIDRSCNAVESTLKTLNEISRTVNTGTDGEGGIRIYRKGQKISWILLGVLQSSSYSETAFCFLRGDIIRVTDRIRYFEEDLKTGSIVVDISDILGPAARYYYANGDVVEYKSDEGFTGPRPTMSTGTSFLSLGMYLAREKTINDGWPELPKLLGIGN